jgi:hypothetical protein
MAATINNLQDRAASNLNTEDVAPIREWAASSVSFCGEVHSLVPGCLEVRSVFSVAESVVNPDASQPGSAHPLT